MYENNRSRYDPNYDVDHGDKFVKFFYCNCADIGTYGTVMHFPRQGPPYIVWEGPTGTSVAVFYLFFFFVWLRISWQQSNQLVWNFSW